MAALLIDAGSDPGRVAVKVAFGSKLGPLHSLSATGYPAVKDGFDGDLGRLHEWHCWEDDSVRVWVHGLQRSSGAVGVPGGPVRRRTAALRRAVGVDGASFPWACCAPFGQGAYPPRQSAYAVKRRQECDGTGYRMSCLKTPESSTLDIPAWFMLMGRFAASGSSCRPESREASACSTVITPAAVVVPGAPSPTVRSRRDTSRR